MPRHKQYPDRPEGGGQRIIKKYPNRRLYDTSTSSYITLAEVKNMVMARQSLVVQDAKTHEDLKIGRAHV